MGLVEEAFLIQDPYHPYAIEFIKRIRARNPKIVPIAFYTNPRLRFYLRHSINIKAMFKDIVEFELEPDDLNSFIEFIQTRYHIVGILPWNEKVMDTSVEIIGKLNLSWNSCEIIKLFRDKYSLKNFLYSNDKKLLPSPSYLVKDFIEFKEIRSKLNVNFVIKPNNGYSNQCVGFFHKDASLNQIEHYFKMSSKFSNFIIEKQLTGEEYAINGQVDEKGKAEIFSIFHYRRITVNGRQNVYAETWNLPKENILFSSLAKYAIAVIEKTGLVRCPFHMEVINDVQDGPVLIEVGCRPGGGMLMMATNDVHDNKIDVFDIAAHYYLNNKSYGKLNYNWQYGNSHAFLDLDGISSRDGYVYELKNKKKVEDISEFVRWTTEPEIGQMLSKTVDLETLPWALHLVSAKGEDHLRQVAKVVRELMDLDSIPHVITRTNLRLSMLIKKVYEKFSWWVYKIKRNKASYGSYKIIERPQDLTQKENSLSDGRSEAS